MIQGVALGETPTENTMRHCRRGEMSKPVPSGSVTMLLTLGSLSNAPGHSIRGDAMAATAATLSAPSSSAIFTACQKRPIAGGAMSLSSVVVMLPTNQRFSPPRSASS